MRLRGSLTVHADGGTDPSTAWERYADPRHWPEWSPQIRRVDLDGGATRIAAGVTGTVRSCPVAARFTITRVDEPAMTWSWTVTTGPVRLGLDHVVAPRPGAGGARTTLRVRGPWPVVAAYTPMAWVALHRLVRR